MEIEIALANRFKNLFSRNIGQNIRISEFSLVILTMEERMGLNEFVNPSNSYCFFVLFFCVCFFFFQLFF